jgi:hypothetical protein
MASNNLNAKVIACYFGKRKRPPYNAFYAFFMLDFLWGYEMGLDQGCPMDTIFVYNKATKYQIEDPDTYKLCEDRLYSFHGKKTKNGECFVVERENIGISYGAFDYAFNLLKDKYEYWLFCEDDGVIIRDNVFSTCIRQMESPTIYGRPVGFVAVTGVNKSYRFPPHAHSGNGCSHRDILNKVTSYSRNYSLPLNRGQLPYWRSYFKGWIPGWHYVHNSEIPFTNSIYTLGYDLIDINMNEVVCIWGMDTITHVNNPRVVPFSEATKYCSKNL